MMFHSKDNLSGFPDGILALALTQIFVAFSDNVVKGAFGILVAYNSQALFGLSTNVALMLGALAFVIPYVLFSGVGGALADAFDNSKLVKWSRLAEFPLALLSAIAIYFDFAFLLFGCLFIYSTQSVIFTSAKLPAIPILCQGKHVVPANALVQSAIQIGVLSGLLVGGVLIAVSQKYVLIAVLLLSAVAGYMSARQIPAAKPLQAEPWKWAKLNPLYSASSAVKLVLSNVVRGSIALMVTWFWMLGLVLTTILPDIARNQLNASAEAANVLIGSFIIGVVVGGFAIARLLANNISLKFVPICAIFMALFLIDLSFAISFFAGENKAEIITTSELLSIFAGWRIIIDLIGFAIFCAAYLAPLYSTLQTLPIRINRAKMLSGGVTLDALISAIFAALVTIAFSLGLTFAWLLIILAIINVLVAIYYQLILKALLANHNE